MFGILEDVVHTLKWVELRVGEIMCVFLLEPKIRQNCESSEKGKLLELREFQAKSND